MEILSLFYFSGGHELSDAIVSYEASGPVAARVSAIRLLSALNLTFAPKPGNHCTTNREYTPFWCVYAYDFGSNCGNYVGLWH
jgi:hypothetical protein